MSEEEKNTEKKSEVVDLSQLQGLDLQANWGERKSFGGKKGGGSRPGGGSRSGGGRPRRDHDRKRNDKRFQKGGRNERPIFKPVVNVSFQPEEAPFQKLCKVLKASYRTYELFEIAKLILDKEDRHVAVLTPIKKEDGTTDPLFISVADKIPFLTREEVMRHAMESHVDKFFTIEEQEREAPKGEFKVINKCGVTGEILGPSNYHMYGQMVKEHFTTRISNMTLEQFEGKIEKTDDPEVLNAWLEKMKVFRVYKPIDKADGEPEVLEGYDAAIQFLQKSRAKKVVKKVDKARISAIGIANLKNKQLVQSINRALDYQKKFPLDTANGIRARLRRMNFTIYKKGSQGISYVCASKRKTRDIATPFAKGMEDLVTFIEKNAMVNAAELPLKYCEIELTKTAEGKIDEEKLSPEDKTKLTELKRNLHWLVSEGYVTEYGDGRLFAREAMVKVEKEAVKPVAKVKAEAQQEVAEPKAETVESPKEEPQQEIAEPKVDAAEPEKEVPVEQKAEELSPAPVTEEPASS